MTTYDQMIADLFDSKVIGMVGMRSLRLALDLDREHGLPLTVGLMVAGGRDQPVSPSRQAAYRAVRNLEKRGLVTINRYNEVRLDYGGITRAWNERDRVKALA